MRYALTESEWQIIQPTPPRRSRGVPRVDDRRILNGIFWGPAHPETLRIITGGSGVFAGATGTVTVVHGDSYEYIVDVSCR